MLKIGYRFANLLKVLYFGVQGANFPEAMKKKKIEPESRHICARCKVRRYERKMTKIFCHPILGAHDFWCCAGNSRKAGCVEAFITECLMYQETGVLQIIRVSIK